MTMDYAFVFLLGMQLMLLVIIALITRTGIVEAQRHHEEVMAHRDTRLELAVARGILSGVRRTKPKRQSRAGMM